MKKRYVITPIVVLLSLFAIGKQAGVYWNMSDSFPPGLYQRLNAGIDRDQLVFVCLPAAVASEAVEKGYVRAGAECPGGAQTLLKKVAGLPGDNVQITDAGVSVNGVLYPNTRQFKKDGAGNPMKRKIGRFTVPQGHLLVLSDYNPLSYDSRYFGTIPESGYRGGAKALIKW
ncbi:conjugative transfer signal peptidase TraF [Microbulbifer aggregans]|uniref:conjugative transfer signal peptidase TraF n=1 Tax=Microbulbifer aggregans TaxID=1769779 RepID=UPI001CFDA511|nr:conjugative transfer signal peptidase TraF [Microbulbifer aggregans]